MKIELVPKRNSELDKQNARDNKKTLGGELFEEPYANIFLCARKKSGKTTAIYNILKHCAGRKTKIICFSSTVFKDKNWLRIADFLKRKDIEFEPHMSIYDEITGQNLLENIIKELQVEAKKTKDEDDIKEAQSEYARKAKKREKQLKQKQNKKRKTNKRAKKKKFRHNGIQCHEDMAAALRTALHSAAKRRKLMNPELSKVLTTVDAMNSPFCMFNESGANEVFEKEMHMAFSGSNRIHQCRTYELQEKLKLDQEDCETFMTVDPQTGLITQQGQSTSKGHSQYTQPKYIFIFDDLSNELRDPYVAHLLKTNRHYLSKVIASSQYVQDMMPSSRKQQDYWMLFAGHSEDKLAVIFKDADTRVTFNQFVQMYKQVTSEPFQFLMIDVVNDVYRRGFNPTPISVKSHCSKQEQTKSSVKLNKLLTLHEDEKVEEKEEEEDYKLIN